MGRPLAFVAVAFDTLRATLPDGRTIVSPDFLFFIRVTTRPLLAGSEGETAATARPLDPGPSPRDRHVTSRS